MISASMPDERFMSNCGELRQLPEAMAIYSTFFVCGPEKLSSFFPGWQYPLPEPVVREFKNPFTGHAVRISTREPDWPEDVEDEPQGAPLEPLSIQGSYEDYLEARLPATVRSQPHWCSKGLAQVELEPLGQAAGVEPALETALYSPPSLGNMLEEIRPDLARKLIAVDDNVLRQMGERWAEIMSDREHTHSASRERVSDGWSTDDAMGILRPLVALARGASNELRIYLLVEV